MVRVDIVLKADVEIIDGVGEGEDDIVAVIRLFFFWWRINKMEMAVLIYTEVDINSVG